MEKTIRELVLRVARTRQLDVNEDAIVQYQDLIGHATVEENRELSNTPELMETYYWIYGVAYGTVASIKFYLNNSYKMIDMNEELDDYKAREEDAKKMAKRWEDLATERKGQIDECKRDMDGTLKELKRLEDTISAQDKEIIRLKAQMFDLIEENEILRGVRKEN